MNMTNDTAFDESVRDFLKALDLPSHHPYVGESHESRNEDQYHEGRGHKTWSVFDYFTPQKHAPVSSKYSKTQNHYTPSSTTVPFALSREKRPEQVSARFSSDEKPNDDNKRYDWLYFNLVWVKEELALAKVVLYDMIESFYQVWPSLRASFHLTLRLFAPLILLGAVLCLIVVQPNPNGSQNFVRTSCIALSMMLLIMTDECYIQEYGRTTLTSVSCLVVGLVVHCSPSTRASLFLTAPFILLALYMIRYCHIYIPCFEAGLYYSSENPTVKRIINQWPVEKRTYHGTPWLVTGDSRTGVPFFLNYIPPQKFVRRWVPSNVPNESEACILDIAFPPDGIHHADKPIYFIVHGLNGGSNEEYVKDFCMRSAKKGSTVAILVTRGLMESPVLGDNLPQFARMSDIDSAVQALRKATAPNQTLAAVGYSMGAIDLATYVAITGKDCPLDAAVALSGALDTRRQIYFYRSKRLWQPMLSKTLRDTFLEKWNDRLCKRLDEKQIKFLSKVDSLVTLDEALMVPYNGFKDLDAYYAAMGAMGDFESFDADGIGRIANVSIPLIMISAKDDVIGYIDTFIDPKQVSESGNGYTMVLLTCAGGHVGWPLGWNPRKNGWKWMSEAAISFIESVDYVLQQDSMKEMMMDHSDK